LSFPVFLTLEYKKYQEKGKNSSKNGRMFFPTLSVETLELEKDSYCLLCEKLNFFLNLGPALLPSSSLGRN